MGPVGVVNGNGDNYVSNWKVNGVWPLMVRFSTCFVFIRPGIAWQKDNTTHDTRRSRNRTFQSFGLIITALISGHLMTKKLNEGDDQIFLVTASNRGMCFCVWYARLGQSSIVTHRWSQLQCNYLQTQLNIKVTLRVNAKFSHINASAHRAL